MSANELAAYWRSSEDAAYVILNTIAKKDEQVAELGAENRKLIKKAGDRPLQKGIGDFISNSWGWIFLILFLWGGNIFGVLHNLTSCAPK